MHYVGMVAPPPNARHTPDALLEPVVIGPYLEDTIVVLHYALELQWLTGDDNPPIEPHTFGIKPWVHFTPDSVFLDTTLVQTKVLAQVIGCDCSDSDRHIVHGPHNFIHDYKSGIRWIFKRDDPLYEYLLNKFYPERGNHISVKEFTHYNGECTAIRFEYNDNAVLPPGIYNHGLLSARNNA